MAVVEPHAGEEQSLVSAAHVWVSGRHAPAGLSVVYTLYSKLHYDPAQGTRSTARSLNLELQNFTYTSDI